MAMRYNLDTSCSRKPFVIHRRASGRRRRRGPISDTDILLIHRCGTRQTDCLSRIVDDADLRASGLFGEVMSCRQARPPPVYHRTVGAGDQWRAPEAHLRNGEARAGGRSAAMLETPRFGKQRPRIARAAGWGGRRQQHAGVVAGGRSRGRGLGRRKELGEVVGDALAAASGGARCRGG